MGNLIALELKLQEVGREDIVNHFADSVLIDKNK